MSKDECGFNLKLEKACRANKEMEFLQAVSKKISRFQNTGANLHHRNNV